MNLSRKYGWLLILPLAASMYCKKSDKDNGSNNGNQPAGPVEIKDTVIVSNLDFPWEIQWGADNFIWMTERGGRISRVNPSTGVVSPLLTISEVVWQGEGGLLGMVLHPDFSHQPYVYVAYDYNKNGDYRGKVVRYTYNNSQLSDPKIIIDNLVAHSMHNGCRLLITPDQKLFISTGDAGNTWNSQDASSPNGKILRLNLDGTVPSDNPVAGNPYWTLGHRNPQGLVYANNKLYSSEHGPNNDDEINIISKGNNYGWPDVEGFCNTSAEQSFCASHSVTEPIKAWTPTIAISGMEYYNHDLIPQWKNSLLAATLKNSRLYQMKLDNNNSNNSIAETNEFFTNKYGRLRDICISPAGKVYICTSNGGNDKIIEVSRK